MQGQLSGQSSRTGFRRLSGASSDFEGPFADESSKSGREDDDDEEAEQSDASRPVSGSERSRSDGEGEGSSSSLSGFGSDSSLSEVSSSEDEFIMPAEIKVTRTVLDRRDSGVAADLKKRFRAFDTNRDGSLDLDELYGLLKKGDPSITMKAAKDLFKQVDKDGSGAIDFDEFVNYLFKPEHKDRVESRRPSFMNQDSLNKLRESAFVETRPAKTVNKLNVVGGTLEEQANGKFSWNAANWIVNSTVGAPSFEGYLNNRPRFGRQLGGCALFFGFIFKPGLGRLEGWFLAKESPPENVPVTDYLLFNPSPNAKTPDQCSAMWEDASGTPDKRMFIEHALKGVSYKGVKHCLHNELWDRMERRDSDAAHRRDLWNMAWLLQDGEVHSDVEDRKGDEEARCTLTPDEWDRQRRIQEARERRQQQEEERRRKEEEERAARAAQAQPGGTGEAESEIAKRRATEAALKARKNKFAMSAADRRARGGITIMDADHLTRHKASTAPTNEAPAGPDMAEMRRKLEQEKKARREREEEELRQRHREEESRKARGRYAEWLEYKQKDSFFVDRTFPPGVSSLGQENPEIGEWMRLSHMHDSACLFHKIVPDDVNYVSSAGNIWFLSAMVAVAEYPSWIQSMFGGRTELHPEGHYKVRLYHPGKKRFVRVTVDDYVPTREGGGPAYVGLSCVGEIWPALIEKAFAKICGSYAQSEWGYGAFGLHYICGGVCADSWSRLGPSQWKRTQTTWSKQVWGGNPWTGCLLRQSSEGFSQDGSWRSPDQLWSTLRRYMELCHPVTCEPDRNIDKKHGLTAGRSYALLGAREVPAGRRVLRMVLLRDPFGTRGWTGRWSFDSNTWKKNKRLGKFLMRSSGSDGSFWMSYTDFLKHFEAINVVEKGMPVQGCHRAKFVGIKRGMGLELS